jgi:hypothetical protein
VPRFQYDPATGNLMGEVLIQSGLRRGSNSIIHPMLDMLTVEIPAHEGTLAAVSSFFTQSCQQSTVGLYPINKGQPIAYHTCCPSLCGNDRELTESFSLEDPNGI